MIRNLNGDDWILKGWLKDQWKMFTQMETGVLSIPVAGPIKAKVPGAVQADLLNAGLIEDWNYALESRKSEWVENREWSLECDFEIIENQNNDRHILCFDGLDHSGIVKLNEKTILEFNGMHRTWKVDITSDCTKVGDNHLQVIFFQPPEVSGQIGYTSHKMELKSRFNYTWDWCPRIVNTGIWRDVYIKSWSKAQITDFYPKAFVNKDLKFIDIKLEIECIDTGVYTIEYIISKNQDVILNGNIQTVISCGLKNVVDLSVEGINAELWWPNGFGDQNIYDVEICLIRNGIVCDKTSKSVGFREISFEINENAAEGSLPYTAVVNNTRMFLRGLNWVPISPLYGTVTRGDYIKYLLILRDMNINILRVWGGAVLESSDFYSLCDEYGIMVWQEFPQSSSGIDNTPCEEQSFIDDLVFVSKLHIMQRRHHACHVIWCGGNELMWHNYIPVDARSSNINSLKKITNELDCGKYFLPASPSGNTFNFNESQLGKCFNHDVHGPWDYLGEIEHYRISNIDDSLFSSEIGCTAMPRLESLIKYSNGMKLWPPDRSNPYYVHRACWWIRLEQLTHLFGEFAKDGSQMQDYVNASRYIQAESLGYSAQAARRAYPVRSGFIVWMGNESFPNSSNTSVIEYDGTAKPSYFKLKSAFAPFDVSARYEKIAWKSDETFYASIFAASDSDISDINISADIFDITGKKLKSYAYTNCNIETINQIGVIEYDIQSNPDGIIILRIEAKKNNVLISKSDYIYTIDAIAPFEPLLKMHKISLDIISDNGKFKVINNSKYAAIGVFGFIRTQTGSVNLKNGYFNLLPGEETDLNDNSCCIGELILEGMNLT